MAPATRDCFLLHYSTQDHHSTHTRGKAQNNFSSYVPQLDVVSHTSMHKTMAVLVAHLPLSKKGRATIVADSSSLQQASGYNTSCMVAYTCTCQAIF